METYEAAKEKLGDAFYGGRNTILQGLHEDKKESVDKMVDDLEKQYVFIHFKRAWILVYLNFRAIIVLFFVLELPNVRNTRAGECTMTTRILTTSTRGTPSSTKNWSASTGSTHVRSSKIWSAVLRFKCDSVNLDVI